jgi:diguanylate cyclase (GGDEF)-like protein
MTKQQPVTYLRFVKESLLFVTAFFVLFSLALLPLSPLAALGVFLFFPPLVCSVYKFKTGGFWFGILSSALFVLAFIASLSYYSQQPSVYYFFSLFLPLAYPVFGWSLGQSFHSLSQLYSELEQLRLSSTVTAIYTKEYLANLIRKYIKEYERYQSHFSLVLLEIDQQALEPISVFRREHILSEIGSILRKNIRAIDEIGRYENQFLLVLPHTGAEGGSVVEERIKGIIVKILNSHGCDATADHVFSVIIAYPENSEGMNKLLKTLEEPIAFADAE